MRTTVTLDSDVVRSLKDEAHRLNKPFKVVINEVIRRGLAPAKRVAQKPYKLVPHKCKLAPDVDPRRSLNQLVDELEAAEFK
jgi:hypothetical protein